MAKSNGNILAVYSFILSIIVSTTNIVMFIHSTEFYSNFVSLYNISCLLTIIIPIISIVGLIYANKYCKPYTILALIMDIMCIICEVYLYYNASYPL